MSPNLTRHTSFSFLSLSILENITLKPFTLHVFINYIHIWNGVLKHVKFNKAHNVHIM